MELADFFNIADKPEKLQEYLDGNGRIVIKIEGDGWNGTVNYRLAHFITELQKAIWESCQIKNPSDTDLEIEVEISKGCSNVVVNLCNLFKNVVNKMSGNQITVIIGIALIGYFVKQGFIEHKQLDSQFNTNLTVENSRLEQIRSANSTINTAMHILGNSLGSNDRIQVNNESFSKEDFLKKYKDDGNSITENSGRMTYAIDGLYSFDSISVEKRSISIKLDNKYRVAGASELSDNDMKVLLNKQLESLGKEQPSCENFRIDVELLGGAVKKVKVIGIGEPRNTALTLIDAKQNSIDLEESN